MLCLNNRKKASKTVIYNDLNQQQVSQFLLSLLLLKNLLKQA